MQCSVPGKLDFGFEGKPAGLQFLHSIPIPGTRTLFSVAVEF